MIAAVDERGERIVFIYLGFSKNVIYMTSLHEIVQTVILALFVNKGTAFTLGWQFVIQPYLVNSLKMETLQNGI